MKKLVILSFFSISIGMSAQLVNTRLVVPEFGNNVVKTYIPTSATNMVVDPSFTINFSALGNGLATAASPNCVTMNGSDLYVSLTNANQRIYKFPNYGTNPATAIANVSEITRAASDYVGIAFDASGNLYTSEGSYLNTQIVKYSGANLTTRTVLGNGGITSYFANIVFDATGNLWVSDYKNNRISVIKVANLTTTNAPMNSIYNASGIWNVSGTSLSNTDPLLASTIVNNAFKQPEGIAFDSTGALWVGNNNDNSDLSCNPLGTLVRISTGLQTTILTNTTTNANTSLLNAVNGLKVWNLPSPAGGSSHCGGLQIDKAINRLYINEQVGSAGLWFDIATINAMTNTYNNHKINMVSTNPGNGGIFLASNTQILGNESFDKNSLKISLYPNPVLDILNIKSNSIIQKIEIIDLNGRILLEKIVNLSEEIININFLETGIYNIKISDENSSLVYKICKN